MPRGIPNRANRATRPGKKASAKKKAGKKKAGRRGA